MLGHPEQQAIYGWNTRPEVASFVPVDTRRVLDVGCGPGGFGSSLRARLGPDAFLMGIDAVEESVVTAREAGDFDEVFAGYFPDAMADDSGDFDLIVFNDVLEHMPDPWSALRACRERLANGGRVLATIPNLRYAPVMLDLVKGNFDYVESGVMDRTHLRFFTGSGMDKLFETSGFRVVGRQGVNNVVREYPTMWRGHRRKARHLLGDMQWMQFVVTAEVA